MPRRLDHTATLELASLAEGRLAKPEYDPETPRGPGRFSFPTTNVFEWHWDHSTTLPDDDRAELLHHAFHAREFEDRTEADALQLAGTDPYVTGRLISGGWLAIDGRAHALWFPAYQAWLDAQAVTR